jgi:AraC family transcriptional regulator of adaptative response/methylated-DNA-[protein]-cysteine methyltransferase
MGLALLDIRKGKTVLDSQLDQGFESASGFREAFARLVGAAPSRAGDVGVLHAKWIETPLGAMLALADDRGLHLLDFVDRRGLERALASLSKRLRARALPGNHRYLDQIERELGEYFEGTRRAFETPVALTGSDFQSRVWNALLAIPSGATCSYAELARRIGHPQAVRAVGRANGENRLVDHRALPSRDRRRRCADGLRRRAREEAKAAGPRARRASARPCSTGCSSR